MKRWIRECIKEKIGKFLLLSVIIIYFGYAYFQQIPQVTFESDEMMWPCMGRIFQSYIRGDWSSPVWRKTVYDFTNGPVPRYLYGAGLMTAAQDLRHFQVVCADTWQQYAPIQRYEFTTQEIRFLYYNRAVNIVVSMVLLLFVFIFLFLQHGTAPAITGTFLLGSQVVFMEYAVRAMVEMLLLLFLVIAQVVFLIISHRILNKKQYTYWVFIFGCICGLAFMTKPYGVMAGCSLVYWILFSRINFRARLKIIFFAATGIAVTILIVYPPFLIHPWSIFEWFQSWFIIQREFQSYFPYAALNGYGARILSVFGRYIYPGKMAFAVPAVNIFVLCFYFLIVLRKLQRKSLTPAETGSIYMIVGFIVFSGFYVYRDWDRYFIPLLLPLVVMYTTVFHACLTLIQTRWRNMSVNLYKIR